MKIELQITPWQDIKQKISQMKQNPDAVSLIQNDWQQNRDGLMVSDSGQCMWQTTKTASESDHTISIMFNTRGKDWSNWGKKNKNRFTEREYSKIWRASSTSIQFRRVKHHLLNVLVLGATARNTLKSSYYFKSNLIREHQLNP